MFNKQLLIVLFIVGPFIIVFGYGIGNIFNVAAKDPGYWLLFIFSALYLYNTYNIFAYHYGWTIFAGPSVVISVDRDKFDRLGSAIVSGIAVAGFMYMWFSNYF